MAESKQNDDQKTNPGTPAPEATDNADSKVAKAAGITEGDVKAMRDDAGLNQLPGHEMDLHAWATTDAGKQFAKDAKDRESEEKETAKKRADSLNKDGLSEAEAKYREAVNKG